MKSVLRCLIAVAYMGMLTAIGSGCAADVELVDGHGYHHHGHYDEHHDWHGGYTDEHNVYHNDPHDWHN